MMDVKRGKWVGSLQKSWEFLKRNANNRSSEILLQRSAQPSNERVQPVGDKRDRDEQELEL